MIKYCKVDKCRYPIYHVTKYHYCGLCKKQGHGIIECGDNTKINKLTYYYNYKLPDFEEECLFGECIINNMKTHKTQSHICTVCYNRLHSYETCPLNINKINIKCPICRINNTKIFKIYGSEDKCVVCFDNVEIFLPECGHNCLCLKCSKSLNTNINHNINQNEIFNELTLYNKKYNISIIKDLLYEFPSYIILLEKNNKNYIVVRRLNKSSELEGLFINFHMNRLELYEKFINGYCKVKLSLDEKFKCLNV